MRRDVEEVRSPIMHRRFAQRMFAADSCKSRCHCEERSDVAIRSLPAPSRKRLMQRIRGDTDCHGLRPRNDVVW